MFTECMCGVRHEFAHGRYDPKKKVTASRDMASYSGFLPEPKSPQPPPSSRAFATITPHPSPLPNTAAQVAALRNKRLDSATMRPLPERSSVLEGGSYLSVAVAAGAAGGGGAPPLATATLDFSNTIGRQLLGRRTCFADFDALPDPTQFQLHNDLKGWMSSSSRLDFLYKELVRQRNAAVRLSQRGGEGGGSCCRAASVCARACRFVVARC